MLADEVFKVPLMRIDGVKWMAVIEFNVLLQKREV